MKMAQTIKNLKSKGIIRDAVLQLANTKMIREAVAETVSKTARNRNEPGKQAPKAVAGRKRGATTHLVAEKPSKRPLSTQANTGDDGGAQKSNSKAHVKPRLSQPLRRSTRIQNLSTQNVKAHTAVLLSSELSATIDAEEEEEVQASEDDDNDDIQILAIKTLNLAPSETSIYETEPGSPDENIAQLVAAEPVLLDGDIGENDANHVQLQVTPPTPTVESSPNSQPPYSNLNSLVLASEHAYSHEAHNVCSGLLMPPAQPITRPAPAPAPAPVPTPQLPSFTFSCERAIPPITFDDGKSQLSPTLPPCSSFDRFSRLQPPRFSPVSDPVSAPFLCQGPLPLPHSLQLATPCYDAGQLPRLPSFNELIASIEGPSNYPLDGLCKMAF